jgi:hypothetical protein
MVTRTLTDVTVELTLNEPDTDQPLALVNEAVPRAFQVLLPLAA